ncbi:MAG TPA: hypothetical protein VJS11_01965 [Acidobacteriaceae bacterium]|nr:hypothetical protein [Acidobacteriaceae bacterium]
MKFRKDTVENPENESGREMREMAEAMSLYRSAMHHIAQKHAEAAAPWASPERLAAEAQHRARAHRMRLVLVPALGAALAAAVIAPAVGHLHHEKAAVARVEPAPARPTATVDDTDLMNQIDSDLDQDVPDALAPLADLSSQPGTTTQSTENRNAQQK